MAQFSGCPGSRMVDLRGKNDPAKEEATGKIQSQLRQWPIQLHLISPTASYYQGADVLLTADCVGYALGGFHPEYLKGKSLAIACPKLDEGQDIYQQKIKSWIDDAQINTLTVLIMQVPCCMGLLNLAQQAAKEANRKVPVKYMVVGIQGEVLKEEWA
ncbi:MAG: 4Fe-4S ferredoxin [Syntrophaceae bacterium]|nr:4Fe-4S ferredoxin [Syntrophaceae bacterium]